MSANYKISNGCPSNPHIFILILSPFFHDSFASLVEHAEYPVESVVVVIRIGHASVLARVDDIQDEMYFFPLVRAGSQTQDILVVLGIHREYQVEFFQVLRLDLPGPLAADIQPELARHPDRAWVGAFSFMPEAGAGGIDMPV